MPAAPVTVFASPRLTRIRVITVRFLAIALFVGVFTVGGIYIYSRSQLTHKLTQYPTSTMPPPEWYSNRPEWTYTP